MEKFQIPFIVNGEIIKGSDNFLSYERKALIQLYMPSISKSVIDNLSKSTNDLIDLSTDEIINFLSKVGRLWRDKEYIRRKEAIELLEIFTGYHRSQLEIDYNVICNALTPKYLWELLDSEVRDIEFLDKWSRIKNSEVRAIPRGMVLHILAGNVPGVGILSLLRGLLSKNSNVLKVASGNPISPLYFVLSFNDVDKNHPITKSTSVLYWFKDSYAEKKLFEMSNAVCVWGGYNSVFAARKKTFPGQLFLEFGPKKSFQFIDEETFKNKNCLEKITNFVAHDIVLHDQKACYSPRVTFVEKNGKDFCKSLINSLEKESKKIKRGYLTGDEIANLYEIVNFFTVLGDDVYRSKSMDWVIIFTNNLAKINYHPSNRVIFIVEVENLYRAIEFIDKSTMVVAFSSMNKLNEMKNEIMKRGVERLTLVGNMGYPAMGFTSEGSYPINNLMRWISKDIPKDELAFYFCKENALKMRINNNWLRIR